MIRETDGETLEEIRSLTLPTAKAGGSVKWILRLVIAHIS